MLQSVMFSDFNAYDFSFMSRGEMGAATKNNGAKVSFARLASWGWALLDGLVTAPLSAHLLRDVTADD